MIWGSKMKYKVVFINKVIRPKRIDHSQRKIILSWLKPMVNCEEPRKQ